MKTNILFTLFLCLSIGLQAQQVPTFALYKSNWSVLNPAAVSDNYLTGDFPFSVSTSYRHQWLKLQDAPFTAVINAEHVREAANMTFGANIIHDQAAAFRSTGIYGQFAYRLNLAYRTQHFINIGLSAGVVQYRGKFSDIDLPDNSLTALEDDNQIHPDFSLGIFYYKDEKYYAGLSIPQTFGLNTNFRLESGEFPIKRVQHAYLIGGAFFDLYLFNSDAAYVEPSFFLRYVPNSPVSLDVHLKAQLNEVFWVGLGGGILSQSIRLDAGVLIGESVNFNNGQLKVGIGLEQPLSIYRNAFGTGIELKVTYSWDYYQ